MPRRVISSGRPVYTRPSYGRTNHGRPRLSRPRFSQRSWRGLVLIFIGVGLILGAWYFFRVTQVIVRGTTRTVEVKTKTEHIIQSHLWWGNLLTIDGGALASAITSADPRLKQASVQRHWPQGIIVTVSDKHPSLVWDTGGERYLIDADGTTIGPVGEQGKGLTVVKDQSNLPTEPGKAVVSPNFVDFVVAVDASLPLQGIKPLTYEVHQTTLDLYLTTDKGYQIIYDTSRPATDELSDLRLVLATLAKEKATPAAYIDLRVAGKAYYK